ncbi:glycosyltransferase family 4 protein [Fusobacterium sp. MFO224]|uniref:glycosyltransferase family 4 protein n=1 Tax=Fusobacterium sp. MFO224 TaxID=3378070 RepID=UPI00385451F3
MKKKLVFIGNKAAPYQVKLCDALQEYFKAQFWFYEYVGERPEWWKIPLGENSKVMKFSGRFKGKGYYSFGLFWDLIKFKPDIIILGGFMRWHLLILKIIKFFNIKVAIMSEPLRNVKNDREESSELVNKKTCSEKIKFFKAFSDIDLYIGMGELAKNQFIREFDFLKENVVSLPYPQDIEEYYKHPLREKKKGDKFTILHANRLIDRYSPLFTLEVFNRVSKIYPNVELYMNNSGPLKSKCVEYIEENNLKNVKFLDDIDSWNNMHLIYKKSDILVLPCTYSNGNGTILEAHASGMGVVISKQINNIKRSSINEKDCFICDLKEEEFAESILKYINDPKLLILHGINGRKLVECRKNSHVAKLYYETFKKHGLLY